MVTKYLTCICISQTYIVVSHKNVSATKGSHMENVLEDLPQSFQWSADHYQHIKKLIPKGRRLPYTAPRAMSSSQVGEPYSHRAQCRLWNQKFLTSAMRNNLVWRVSYPGVDSTRLILNNKGRFNRLQITHAQRRSLINKIAHTQQCLMSGIKLKLARYVNRWKIWSPMK